MKQRQQLNIYVRPEIAKAVGKICDELGWTRNEAGEVAYAVLFGVRDNLIMAKLEKWQQTAKNKGIVLPFEMPLTPFN